MTKKRMTMMMVRDDNETAPAPAAGGAQQPAPECKQQ